MGVCDNFLLRNIELILAHVQFLIMLCLIIRPTTYVKTVLEQTCALYYQRQSMKGKLQYFHLFAKLRKISNFCDVTDEQLLKIDDQ